MPMRECCRSLIPWRECPAAAGVIPCIGSGRDSYDNNAMAETVNGFVQDRGDGETVAINRGKPVGLVIGVGLAQVCSAFEGVSVGVPAGGDGMLAALT